MEDKYKLPWTHEAIQDQSILDLLSRYWEDYYVKHPTEAKRSKNGEVYFETGDPLIDKWEREIAQGLDPDLLEGLPPERRERELRAREKLEYQENKMLKLQQLGDGFSENYLSE